MMLCIRMPQPQHVHCPLCAREVYRRDDSDRWSCCGCGAVGWYRGATESFRVNTWGRMIWRDADETLVEGEVRLGT